MQSFKVIFNITFRQIILSKKTIFMVIISFLPVLLSIYYRVSERSAYISPDQALSQIIMFFIIFISTLVSLFYGTAVVGDEVENRTIIYLFTRPVRKYSIIAGKFAAYILGVLLVLIPPMLMIFLIISTDSAMTMDFATSVIFFEKQLGITLLSLFVYGAIFIFFGTSLKRSVIIGLLFAFGWEKITIVVPGVIRKLSVAHYILSAVPKDPTTQEIINKMSKGTASSGHDFSIAVLLILTVIFLGLTIFTIYRKEYRFE